MSPNLHVLRGVVEAKADLLGFLRLGGGTWRLQRWDLLVVGEHRLGVDDHSGHLDGEVGGFDEEETLFCRRRRWRGWPVGIEFLWAKASSIPNRRSAVWP